MTPQDAARLLDLPANATPAQIEAHFLELRALLEDKLVLTPQRLVEGHLNLGAVLTNRS